MDKLLKQVKHMEGNYNVTRKKAQQWYSVDDKKNLLLFCIQDKKR